MGVPCQKAIAFIFAVVERGKARVRVGMTKPRVRAKGREERREGWMERLFMEGVLWVGDVKV